MTAPTVVVDGKQLATTLRQELADEIGALVAAGRRPPCLAVVLVGDNPASISYIKGKRRACERAGMASREHDLPATASQAEVVALVESLNRDLTASTASSCSSRCRRGSTPPR
jgi:methylenetetrahydrofolate dehydrogenase (NADP+)/methenyltetrahydrofolate cyclohydrolase